MTVVFGKPSNTCYFIRSVEQGIHCWSTQNVCTTGKAVYFHQFHYLLFIVDFTSMNQHSEAPVAVVDQEKANVEKENIRFSTEKKKYHTD